MHDLVESTGFVPLDLALIASENGMSLNCLSQWRDRLGLVRTAVSLSMLTVWPLSSCMPAETWIEDTFEDFADGRLDAAGQNLYVSRDGAVRTIHRFDLNQDGYIDLVFNSTHDTATDLPATEAKVDSDGGVRNGILPVGGSLNVALGDLNRDGFIDAAFCPNRGGVQQGRHFVTIAWGGVDGWRPQRLTRTLPVHEAPQDRHRRSQCRCLA